MNIKLELTVDEVNAILRSLGKHPFEEIALLINKIKEQGEPQVAEMAKAQEAAATETAAAVK
jgi:CHASE3 domain sensor protein